MDAPVWPSSLHLPRKFPPPSQCQPPQKRRIFCQSVVSMNSPGFELPPSSCAPLCALPPLKLLPPQCLALGCVLSFLPWFPRFGFQCAPSLSPSTGPASLPLFQVRCGFGYYVTSLHSSFFLWGKDYWPEVFFQDNIISQWQFHKKAQFLKIWQYLPVWPRSMAEFWAMSAPLFLNLASLLQLGDCHSPPSLGTAGASSWCGFSPKDILWTWLW